MIVPFEGEIVNQSWFVDALQFKTSVPGIGKGVCE